MNNHRGMIRIITEVHARSHGSQGRLHRVHSGYRNLKFALKFTEQRREKHSRQEEEGGQRCGCDQKRKRNLELGKRRLEGRWRQRLTGLHKLHKECKHCFLQAVGVTEDK